MAVLCRSVILTRFQIPPEKEKAVARRDIKGTVLPRLMYSVIAYMIADHCPVTRARLCELYPSHSFTENLPIANPD
jgi:hypothetical protein